MQKSGSHACGILFLSKSHNFCYLRVQLFLVVELIAIVVVSCWCLRSLLYGQGCRQSRWLLAATGLHAYA